MSLGCPPPPCDGEVHVVAIEVANHHRVGECRQLDRRRSIERRARSPRRCSCSPPPDPGRSRPADCRSRQRHSRSESTSRLRTWWSVRSGIVSTSVPPTKSTMVSLVASTVNVPLPRGRATRRSSPLAASTSSAAVRRATSSSRRNTPSASRKNQSPGYHVSPNMSRARWPPSGSRPVGSARHRCHQSGCRRTAAAWCRATLRR